MSSNPINPFKDIRLQAKLSQYEVARRAGVTKHAVLRLEQGMFKDPAPTLLNYFVANYKVSRLSVIRQYESFQIETRENTGRVLGDLPPDVLPPNTHPLTYLRERVGHNVTSLAKVLCLSQSTIGYFEKRPINQHTVPDQLVIALHDAGYTSQETDWLEEAYLEYRKGLVSHQDLKVTSLSSVGALNHGA